MSLFRKSLPCSTVIRYAFLKRTITAWPLSVDCRFLSLSSRCPVSRTRVVVCRWGAPRLEWLSSGSHGDENSQDDGLLDPDPHWPHGDEHLPRQEMELGPLRMRRQCRRVGGLQVARGLVGRRWCALDAPARVAHLPDQLPADSSLRFDPVPDDRVHALHGDSNSQPTCNPQI